MTVWHTVLVSKYDNLVSVKQIMSIISIKGCQYTIHICFEVHPAIICVSFVSFHKMAIYVTHKIRNCLSKTEMAIIGMRSPRVASQYTSVLVNFQDCLVFKQ